MQSELFKAWKLGLSTSLRVLCPKYDMDAYVEILSRGEVRELC